MARWFVAVLAVAAGCGAAGQPVSTTGVLTVELASTFCGAAVNKCEGQRARLVDFQNKTLQVHVCTEPADGGVTVGSTKYGPQLGDALVERALTDVQLDSVRTAAAGVRTVQARITEFDGAMTVLTVTTPTGTTTASPNARCGNEPYTQIVSGLPALQTALDAL